MFLTKLFESSAKVGRPGMEMRQRPFPKSYRGMRSVNANNPSKVEQEISVNDNAHGTE